MSATFNDTQHITINIYLHVAAFYNGKIVARANDSGLLIRFSIDDYVCSGVWIGSAANNSGDKVFFAPSPSTAGGSHHKYWHPQAVQLLPVKRKAVFSACPR